MKNNKILLESLKHKISEIPLIVYRNLEDLLVITPSEGRIFVTLLLYDALSAREIAFVTDVPRTKVYNHIKSLVTKGIIIERSSKPANVYFATDPKLLYSRYITRWKSHLLDREERLGQLVDMLIGLQSEEKLMSNPENISVSNTFPEIYRAIEDANSRVWIVASGKGGMYNWSETANTLAELVNRGIDVTYIVDKPIIPQILEKHFRPLLDKGKSIRTIYQKVVPHNMLIVDENLFIINISPESSSIENVQHRDIVNTYILYLEGIIEGAKH